MPRPRQGTFHMMISNPVVDVNGDTATAAVHVDRSDEFDRSAAGPQLWEQGREYDLLVPGRMASGGSRRPP